MNEIRQDQDKWLEWGKDSGKYVMGKNKQVIVDSPMEARMQDLLRMQEEAKQRRLGVLNPPAAPPTVPTHAPPAPCQQTTPPPTYAPAV